MGKKVILLCLAAFWGANAHADCDIASAARKMVKAVVAIEDITGITAYYGGIAGGDEIATSVTVQPHYQSKKDWYVVKVRKADCRVLSLELKAEKIPL